MEKISHFRLYKRHRATLYRQIQKNTDYERPAWNNITALAMKTGIPERIVEQVGQRLSRRLDPAQVSRQQVDTAAQLNQLASGRPSRKLGRQAGLVVHEQPQ